MTRAPRFAIIVGTLFRRLRISFRVSILASGSAGNSTLLETANTRLLIDAGLSKRETLRRLTELGTCPAQLDGILISHEHTDHCAGLPQLLGKWKTTVYATEPTLEAIVAVLPNGAGERIDRISHIQAGQRFTIGDIEVSAFAIPHDAVDPLGFTFRANGTKVAIVTDLGYLPELVKQHLRGADLLVLESNHDLEMLKVGPYPWHIKQRVMSRTGHLSNHTVSEYLADVDSFDAQPQHLVLAHLSENNNNPDVARISAEEALRRRIGGTFAGQLHIASQRVPLGPFNL